MKKGLRMITHYLLTGILALIGALLFDWLHMPMPWLLGPLFTTMVLRLATPLPIAWHKELRNLGLVLAGYSIGVSFTTDAFAAARGFLPLMIAINVFYIGLFVALSKLIVHRTHVDTLAALTSTVPGGMTQITAYAAEKKSKHMTMITFYQVLRVLCLLSIVPVLLSVGAMPEAPQHIPFSVELLGMIVLSFVAGIIADKLRVPTGYLLGPVILLMMLQIFGMRVPLLPPDALHIAQLLIGVFIGMLLRKEDLRLSKKVMLYGFISAFVYIGSAYVLALIIPRYYSIDFTTAFLSTIPGGLDQMGLIAMAAGADVTLVTMFQLFRVLVVSLLVVPALKMFTK
ncbi:AbrB family transcriptional regulator [Caryophanon latum]|nr:AbrB family transcriptional regulator [Caryophanon latum]